MAGSDIRRRLGKLLALAWPVIVARSAQAVIGFTDTLMTSGLGEDAIAATTSGAMNVFAIAILPMGLVFIVQSFAAQLDAKGQTTAVWRYAHYALLLALLAGAIGAALIPVVPHALALLPHEPEVREPMSDYMQIRLWALGGIVAVEAIGNWYGGRGNTRLHMVASLTGMVLNVGLNYVLIHGRFGAPALGVRGAAIASVVATYGALAFLAFVFVRDRRRATAMGPLRSSEFARMIRFGLPNGLNWFLEFAAFLFFLDVVVADIGTVALASMMIVFHVNSISFMPAFGLASAGAILTGHAIGEGNKDEVPRTVRMTATVAACWQGVVGLVYFVIPGLVVGLFAPPTENADELVALSAAMLRISVAWQLFDAIAMVVGEALRSAGDTKWCLFARLGVAWLLFVPLSYFVVDQTKGSALAAIGCIVAYLGALAMLFLWRFRGGAWRLIDLTGTQQDLLAE